MSNVRTFGVLAGAYLRSDDRNAYLLHACEVDAEGYPIRVLCNGVKLRNICPDGYTDEQLARTPTCPKCAKKVAK